MVSLTPEARALALIEGAAATLHEAESSPIPTTAADACDALERRYIVGKLDELAARLAGLIAPREPEERVTHDAGADLRSDDCSLLRPLVHREVS